MALGTILGAAAGGLASAAGSSLLGGLFGGNKSTTPAYTPPGINAGGLSGTAGNITSSADRQNLVTGVADQFGQQADVLGGLRASVAPGVSDLRAARLAEIDNARNASVSNLRDNMARRRVLGSSFGQDALARADLEFGQAREKTQADSFLQELELTNQIANQEFQARRSQFQTGLDELNLQADIATKLASSASAQLGANARLEAELNAKSNAGAGKFFGEVSKPIGDAIGKQVSKWAA